MQLGRGPGPRGRWAAKALIRGGDAVLGTHTLPAAPAPPLPARASTGRFVVFGAAQLVLMLVPLVVTAGLLDIYLRWVWTATEPLDLYLRNVAFGAGSFLALSVVPILVKWLLIGRWTAREIPLWSGAHLRLWMIKTLIRTSPMVMFAGSPLYLVYLRALGARVGRGVTVLSSTVPIGTDLLTIGDGTVRLIHGLRNYFRPTACRDR